MLFIPDPETKVISRGRNVDRDEEKPPDDRETSRKVRKLFNLSSDYETCHQLLKITGFGRS